jgi:hypothetical protein
MVEALTPSMPEQLEAVRDLMWTFVAARLMRTPAR